LFALSALSWTGLGPATISGGPYLASGRVNVAVADPQDPNVMFVGTPQGGVWVTHDWTDATPPWTPLTDGQPSIAIAEHGLTLFPGHGGGAPTLYAAANGPDGGVIKLTSPDGGATWDATRTTSQFADALFGAVVVSPADPTGKTLYVAVSGGDGAGTAVGGVWQSTDGGQTFTNLTPAGFGSVLATDLAIDPTDPTVLYAGLVDDKADRAKQGVYQIKINPGGTPPTWTQAGGAVITSGADVGNFIKLAVAPDTSAGPAQTVVYATIFNANPGSTVPLLDRFRAEGGVGSWVKLNPLSTTSDDSDDRTNHVVLAADPSNPNRIYVNGSEPELFVGTFAAGHATWTQMNPEYPNSGTEDVADVTFDASATPRPILTGDRGIGVSTTSPAASGTFLPRDGNLSDVFFYKLAVDPADPAVAYGVAQDQFHVLNDTNGPTWQLSGAGNEIGTVLIDPGHPNVVYNLASAYRGNPPHLIPDFLSRSDSAGAPGSWKVITSGINESDFPPSSQYVEDYYSALAMDPGNPSHLVLGTYRVYETTTGGEAPQGGGNGWTVISPDLSGGQQLHLTAIAVAGATSGGELIYAATDQGKFFVSPPRPDATTAWTARDAGLPGPGGNIKSIAVDPHNAQHVFLVTERGATGGQTVLAGVWETTDGGAHWTSVTGNLPSSPALYSVAPDWRFTTPVLYVGTQRGVYRSTNDGASWVSFDPGMPNTEAQDLELLPQTEGGMLAAGTYGRGAYEIALPAAPTLAVSGPAAANQGDTLTYTVAIANNTPANASQVVLTDALPAGLQFISGAFGSAPCTFANGKVTCTLGTLNAGATVTGTITAQAAAAGMLVSQASLNGTLPVTVPTGASATATTAVAAPAPTPAPPAVTPPAITDVTARVTVSRPKARHGHGSNPAMLQLTLMSGGGTAITGPLYLVLRGLPKGVRLKNASGTATTAGFAGDPFVTVSTSGLAPGQSITVTLRFKNPKHKKLQPTPDLLAGPDTV
jgi:uncharacterized repeat protein (TIGR01451 family)